MHFYLIKRDKSVFKIYKKYYTRFKLIKNKRNVKYTLNKILVILLLNRNARRFIFKQAYDKS